MEIDRRAAMMAGLAVGVAAKPGAKLAQAIKRDFGSHARCAAEFTGMGKGLGGGSGWSCCSGVTMTADW